MNDSVIYLIMTAQDAAALLFVTHFSQVTLGRSVQTSLPFPRDTCHLGFPLYLTAVHESLDCAFLVQSMIRRCVASIEVLSVGYVVDLDCNLGWIINRRRKRPPRMHRVFRSISLKQSSNTFRPNYSSRDAMSFLGSLDTYALGGGVCSCG
jgi:hypothetical protein